MKLTFTGGPCNEKVYDSPTAPDRIDWPFWELDRTGAFCHGVDRYTRRKKTHIFDYERRIPAVALPVIDTTAFLSKSQVHRLECRLARDKERADKLARQLGVVSVEEKEKLDEIANADKAIAELKAQMEALEKQAAAL